MRWAVPRVPSTADPTPVPAAAAASATATIVFSAQRLDLGHDLVQQVPVSAHKCDVSSGAGKLERCRPPDAGARARDQCHAPVQPKRLMDISNHSRTAPW